LFIEYELDEFELNGINVYGWYDIVLMFVNDMKWWSEHSIFRKRDTHVEIVRMCIVWRFYKEMVIAFISVCLYQSMYRKYIQVYGDFLS